MRVLHFDAHTDCHPPGPGRNEAASALRRAYDEGLVATGASVHVGLRGPTPNTTRVAHEMGYRTLSMRSSTAAVDIIE